MTPPAADFPTSSHHDARRRKRTNTALLYWLLLLLALAPIPLGGNRPILVAAYAAIAGSTVFVYVTSLLVRGLGPSLPLSRFRVEITLWLLTIAVLLLQLLPLGEIAPIVVQTASGVSVAARQLTLTPGNTWLQCLEFCGLGSVYLLAAQVGARRERGDLFMVGAFVIITALAAWGLISLVELDDTLLGMPKWAYQGFATSTFVNRNTFATCLSMGLAIGLAVVCARLSESRDKALPLAHTIRLVAPFLAGMALIAAALLATQSRMGLLAGLVGLVVTGGLWLVVTRRGGRFALGSGVILMAAIGIVFVFYGQGLLDRLGSSEVQYDARWPLYRQVWQMIWARPWLGYGGNSFEYAFPLFHRAPVSLDLVWDKAHSTYLALWSELGLVAGSLPLLAVAVIVWRLTRNLLGSALVSSNVLGAIGVCAVCAIHSIVDFSLEIQAVAYLFAAVLGAGSGGLGTGSAGRTGTERLARKR